jgi:RNA polymerase sigma factor (sigma-70 family)
VVIAVEICKTVGRLRFFGNRRSIQEALESHLITEGPECKGSDLFADALTDQIESLLEDFDGETSLKRLFWELLSYDRVRDPLPLSYLPPSARDLIDNLEVFAAADAFTVILAVMKDLPSGILLEQISWALKRHIINCLVLLHDSSAWILVYPDELAKPRVRIQFLPGPKHLRSETARSLAALDSINSTSGDPLQTLKLAENLDTFFPGIMPHLDDLFDDFDRIKRHPDPEVQNLFQFIKDVGKYPLLTPAQEQTQDITKGDAPPDGTGLSYYQWRLVVHNLRMVIWMARRIPRVGMDLSDLVQDGAIGLMTAARRFEPTLGNRFSTYAFYWIRQALFRGLYNSCNLIRWPVWISPKLITASLEGKKDGLKPGEIPVAYVPWNLSLASLQPVDPIELVSIQEKKTAVQIAIGRLKPIEKDVIARRFGIGHDHEHTLEEIGREHGLTRERIRQIEAKALTKLHKSLLGLTKEPE